QHDEVSQLMIKALADLLTKHRLSSAHILFPDQHSSDLFAANHWLKRPGVQFGWH
ncbi:MAG TPA: GNAT family N-acetyltransferase, partial [Methylophilaceae bacterium]|nr:GNAT family N-acetyltransferase [Methylophilaceae bacterium]